MPTGRALVLALGSGAAALALFAALAWPSLDAAYMGIDFNGALFEDFLGPYWNAATALAAGESTPAPQYLYPAFFAWLLVPFVSLGPAAASWLCLGLMAGSAALLLASAFTLRPAPGPFAAASLGVATCLAQPVVNGAYWGQASLIAVALSAAGFAAWSRDRSAIGGVLVGVAAAIKLTPLVFCLAPLLRKDSRALAALALTFGACAVALPVVLMGPSGALTFHAEIGARLSRAATLEGGFASQDAAALWVRAFGASAVGIGRALGVALALGCLYLASRSLTKGKTRWGLAYVALAAVPSLVAGPTWSHRLAWVVVAWWIAALDGRVRGRSLVLLSVGAGSVVALRLVGDPARYAQLGLPALAAALAVAAAAAVAGGAPGHSVEREP